MRAPVAQRGHGTRSRGGSARERRLSPRAPAGLRGLPERIPHPSTKISRTHSGHPPHLILVDVRQPVVGEHVAQPAQPSPGLVSVRILNLDLLQQSIKFQQHVSIGLGTRTAHSG